MQHAGVGHLWRADAVEPVEMRFLEGTGDLDGTIAPEVEEDDRIAVLDGADGLAGIGNDECRQILVDGAGILRAQAVDRSRRGRELRALAQHVRFPALLDHRPVGVVAVHGDVLAAAAGGDAGIEAALADLGEESLEGHDVIERAGFRHVATVEQDVHPHGLDAFGPGLNDHGLQVIDVAVHVAVGEQTHEMDHTTTGLGTGDDLLPRLALPDGAGGNGIGDQRRALAVDLAGADSVVTDLGIAHVVVGRHADRGAVGAQADIRIVREQLVEGRLAGSGDGAAGVGFGDAVAVDHDNDDRAVDSGERSELLQHDGFLRGKRGMRACTGAYSQFCCASSLACDALGGGNACIFWQTN